MDEGKSHGSWTIVLPLVVTVFLAFAGYYFTRHNELHVERRKAQIARVDAQLKELYGPLYALSNSNSRAWIEFRKKYRPGHTAYWDTQDPPSQAEADAWRLWMREVFAPMNQQMETLITAHTDLMEEAAMPAVLLDFIAHTVGYKPVLKAWERNDTSQNTSLIDFPDQDRLLNYARDDYQLLKARQAALLGHLKGPDSDVK
jgi:hypothetical protein